MMITNMVEQLKDVTQNTSVAWDENTFPRVKLL
jgi:hypothetical protein